MTDLSIYLSLFLSSNYLSIHRSTYLSIYLPIYLSIYLSIYVSLSLSHLMTDLSIDRSIDIIYLSASLKTKLFCETCSVFKLDNIKNAAIQRDFLNFCAWQHQKQSTSARLPTCFQVHNIKNERNSARLPSKMESWVQSWRPRTNAFCDFSSPPV